MDSPAREINQLEEESPASTLSLTSTRSSLGKRSRNEPEETWEELMHRLRKSKKDDFSIRYFFTSGEEGMNVEQEDRDFVAQVMEYYAFKSKRDTLVAIPPLAGDIRGVSNNRDENHPIRVVFKTAKHLHAMYAFLHQSRAAHHNMIVNVSVDGSPYHQVL